MNFVQETKKALSQVGYEASESIAAQIALLLAQKFSFVRAMLLEGPPGAGKTSLAEAVAAATKAKLLYVPCHRDMGKEDFLFDANIVQILRGIAGDATAVTSGDDVVELGFIPQVFQASLEGPVVALVDELDKTSASIDSLFLSILQRGEVLIRGIGTIKANLDNIIFFFTKNGDREVHEALMRRCRRIELAFPEQDLKMQILAKRMQRGDAKNALTPPAAPTFGVPEDLRFLLVTAANTLREHEDYLKPPCTQELFQALEDIRFLVQWGELDLILEAIFQWLAAFPEDRELAHSELVQDGSFPSLLQDAMGG